MAASVSRRSHRGGESFRPATKADLDQRRFERNLKAFADNVPLIHQRLSAITQPRSRLLISNRGDFDIEFGGVRLYGTGARAASRRDVDAFFKNPSSPSRISIATTSSVSFDQYANATTAAAVRRAETEAGAQFAPNPTPPCFHIVVMGVGLAEQLPMLIEKSDCKHLILIEPNTEFLYHSLYTFDWWSFLRKASGEGRIVSFDPNSTPKNVAVGVRDQLRYINVAFIDGTYIFKSYQSSFLESAAHDMAADVNLLMTGLGFLEDEIDMVRNTYHNLKNYDGKYFLQKKSVCNLPAFVIASGPSLDNDLAFLRANADRAVVISCGTSIRILLRNGIVPDFHMEMENVPAVTDLMNRLSASFSFKDITLVASTTVDPGVKPHFDNAVFYFRSGLSSFPMFSPSEDAKIPYGYPTVSNLGLSFAQQIGCKTIYLFGVDLGARDPKKHHAKDAPYNAGELEFNTVIDSPVPGNLGGTVYSEFVYLWSRDQLQEVILRFGPNLTYYNCSDGVRILGATPRLSRTISLPSVTDKEKSIAEILSRFDDYTPELFAKAWTDRNVVLNIRTFQKNLLECCLPHKRSRASERRQSPRIELDYMYRVVRLLIPAGETAPEIHYYRGSTFMAMIGLHYHLTRIHDPKKRRVVGKIFREEFIKILTILGDRVVEFYRDLDPDKFAADEAEAEKVLGRALRKLKVKLAPRSDGARRFPHAGRARRKAPRPRSRPTKKTLAKRPASRGRDRRKLRSRPVRGQSTPN